MNFYEEMLAKIKFEATIMIIAIICILTTIIIVDVWWKSKRKNSPTSKDLKKIWLEDLEK